MMHQPILFVKKGCPYCAAAIDYLDQRKVGYQRLEVRGRAEAMDELQRVSGQTKTPTLLWDDDVLANFGVDELEPFLAKHQK